MNGAFVRSVAIAVLAASSSVAPADPPSGTIDPPPGPQDYVASFPARTWVFGQLLWKNREPCTNDYCEAAFNAQPLFLLVQKEKACCGGDGYSLTVVGRVEGCASSSYYLAWSKDFDMLGKAERLAFVSRHVTQIASAISSSCGKSLDARIPTDALLALWG
jgi:hypothetical protein